MTNTKHTPGPWHVAGLWDDKADDCLVWDKEAAICQVFRRSEMLEPQATQAANSRLIAAAPDLLAALQKIEARSHDAIHSVTEARQWVRQFREIARAALAKSGAA